jgi:hypothetical protein
MGFNSGLKCLIDPTRFSRRAGHLPFVSDLTVKLEKYLTIVHEPYICHCLLVIHPPVYVKGWFVEFWRTLRLQISRATKHNFLHIAAGSANKTPVVRGNHVNAVFLSLQMLRDTGASHWRIRLYCRVGEVSCSCNLLNVSPRIFNSVTQIFFCVLRPDLPCLHLS